MTGLRFPIATAAPGFREPGTRQRTVIKPISECGNRKLFPVLLPFSGREPTAAAFVPLQQ